MSLPTFFRGSLPDLWIGLEASEALGLVDGIHAVQDPSGVGGQLALQCVSTGTATSVPMASWGPSGATLGGRVPLAGLLAGEYQIRGRVVGASTGSPADFSLGFILADGPAPQNGAVDVPADAPGAPDLPLDALPPAVVAIPPAGPTDVPFLAPTAPTLAPDAPPPATLPFLAPGAPNLASGALPPAVVAILLPGTAAVPFPAAAAPAVAFPPPSLTVEF